MSNKYKILELLNQESLTIQEIANKTEFNQNEVRVYIYRLKKDNLVKELGKKNRFIIYTAAEKNHQNNNEFIKIRKGYQQFNSLFEKLMKNATKLLRESQINMFKQMIRENIEINLIKEINSEMVK